MEVSCAAHETSTLYPQNLKYTQKFSLYAKYPAYNDSCISCFFKTKICFLKKTKKTV